MEILLLVLFLYASIGLHEWAHYVLAQRYGVRVRVFALGGPPWPIRRRWGETEFRLGLLPFMGYVEPDERALRELAPLRQARIYLAGPLANFVVALVAILALGFADHGFWERGLTTLVVAPVMLIEVLGQALSGTAPAGEVGFKAFFTHGSAFLAQGWKAALGLWTAMNLLVAWFNLLPIPPLDGGKILFALLPKTRWFRLAELGLTALGLVFLAVSLLVALGYDLGLLGR